MGDCRIRVLIARELLPGQPSSTDGEWHATTYTDSADATVQDVWEVAVEPLFGQASLTDHACLWDCTLHPPKDITEWLSSYNEKTGPKSKTLYDAGWYPSGTWQLLPRGKQPIYTQNYDDVQYNLPSALISTSAVRLVDNETMTPSQVLQSVTTRCPKEEDSDDAAKALEIRRERQQEKEIREAERHARLEKRIRQLNSSDKPVATQVRRMLIKSRCTGSSHLKLHDRVYFHLVVVVKEETLEDYHYFSQQDTVARVIAISKVKLPQEAELLVRYNHGYRRLPVTMRLYEAIAEKYLEQVDSVVIRCFTPPEEEPTISILERAKLECDAEMEVNVDQVVTSQDESVLSIKGLEARKTVMDDAASDDVCNQMTNAITAMDEATSSKSKKKTSSTSHKVHTMLIKSKAKGDTKRVPKMADRFFLELVVISFFEGECIASASFVFLAKIDPVGRLLRDCVSIPVGFEATVLVPTEEGGFRQVPDDISLQDAENKGFFKSFDRVVVRIHKP
jgi:hypothetical protein